jgi:hypothetical protein
MNFYTTELKFRLVSLQRNPYSEEYYGRNLSKLKNQIAIQNMPRCTWQKIISLIRFRGSRLTQLCFNSFLLFYSNYPLHVSVVRPSSSGKLLHIYIYLFKLSATCFGRTAIFKWKIYTYLYLYLFIQIIRSMFRSYGHLQVENIYIFIFIYSNYPPHISAVRPSWDENIYISASLFSLTYANQWEKI